MEPNVNQEENQASESVERELKTRFELLPTELQQVITSSDYQTKLFDIAKKHKLTYERLGQLELETTMVLLGMTPPDEFKLDISEQLQLSATDLDSVVLDINDQIFKPIRDNLMNLYSEKEVSEGEKYAVEKTKSEALRKENTTTTTETKSSSSLSTLTPSPYRESISGEDLKGTGSIVSSTKTNEPFKPTPSINSGVIPTTEKNTVDAKQEMVSKDPYRELPLGEVKDDMPPVPLSKDFLSGIPTLSPKVEKQKEDIKPVDLAKASGAISTMSQVKEASIQTSAEAAKNISSLKDILTQKISLLPKKNEDLGQIVSTQKITLENIKKETFPDATKPINPEPILNLNALDKVISTKDTTDKTIEKAVIDSKNEVSKITVKQDDVLAHVKEELDLLNKKTEPLTKQIPRVEEQFVNQPTNNVFKKNSEIKIPPISKMETSKDGAIFDDEVRFVDEKVSAPGFFAKLKNLFTPKKPVDVLVKQNIVTKKEDTPTQPQGPQIV